MNLDYFTDDEFINHLDCTSNDPLIRRLVKIFQGSDEMMFQQLIEVGMNKDGRFETDYE